MLSPYSQRIEDVFRWLAATSEGLSAGEASQRLKQFGPNEIKGHREPFWKKLLEPFRSIFVIILLLAAVFSFAFGENLDGLIIVVIIAINSAIYYTQRRTTDRVLKSLKQHSQQMVTVFRDNLKTSLPSNLLVPGDVIELSEGVRIPAYGRIFHQDNLYTDESTLTGESLPVKKSVAPLAVDRPIYERANMAYSGTYVLSGTGLAVVTATGMSSEFGKIAGLAISQEPKSPMQAKIDQIVSRLIKLLAGVALVVFGLALARGIAPDEAVRFVLAMSVSAVPEELPIAISVILVLAMRKLAGSSALIRSMKTMEDIGIVTLVAVDKTGTLTKNNLAVASGWLLDEKLDLKEIVRKSLGKINEKAEPFDKALATILAGDHGGSGQLIKHYPFEQKQRLSGALWREGDSPGVDIKGAPEHIINLCRLGTAEHKEVSGALISLTARGYRVIAIAKAAVNGAPADLNNGHLKYQILGLVALSDELRPESAPAIAQAHAAGIKTVMITGDHYETAFHVGKTLGICTTKDQVIEGTHLPDDSAAFAKAIKGKKVFARILPEQKFDILKALKNTEVVAMTGDGVNDVPALALADVGIAIGSGSDIARDSGDMVLLDSNFASITKAISAGRVIYDNIRRMLFYLLSTSLGEILAMVSALLLGLPLPVTAVQILWITLVPDTSLAIPLGMEPPEDNHMSRPPRPPKAPILNRVILQRIVVVGAVMAGVTIASFAYLLSQGHSEEYARTVAFMMLVAAQWANAFNARSETQSLITRLKVPNRKLLVGLGLAVTAQLLVLFGPLKNVFEVSSISFSHLIAGILISVVSVWLAVDIHKLINRKK